MASTWSDGALRRRTATMSRPLLGGSEPLEAVEDEIEPEGKVLDACARQRVLLHVFGDVRVAGKVGITVPERS